MTLRGIVISAAVCGALVFLAWEVSVHTVPPDITMQSAFFRRDLKPLLETYRKGCSQGFQSSANSSAAAGERSFRSSRNVRFSQSIETEVCDQPDSDHIVSELYYEMHVALKSAQCRYSQNSPPTWGHGFRISYTCGERSSGVLSVAPPRRTRYNNRSVLKLSLHVDEQWSVADRSGTASIAITAQSYTA